MADIPAAPLEGSSSTSTDNVPMLTMTQDDDASGLQAVLLNALRSETVNGQLLGALLTGRDITQSLTLLTSAARTATTESSDQTNYEARGVILTLDATAISSTPSVVLSIEHKCPVSGEYETLFTASAAVTAVGTHTYVLYPGDVVAADDVTEVGKLPLPRTWRAVVTHGDSNSITYSVGGSLLA